MKTQFTCKLNVYGGPKNRALAKNTLIESAKHLNPIISTTLYTLAFIKNIQMERHPAESG
jgi:hypothetical protein